LAGFQLIVYGRFWVFTEAAEPCWSQLSADVGMSPTTACSTDPNSTHASKIGCNTAASPHLPLAA